MTLRIADLFCGAGGTSTGAVQAARNLGHAVELTADQFDAGFLELVKRPTANPESRRLSIKESIRCVELQSNQLWSLIRKDVLETDFGKIAGEKCPAESRAVASREQVLNPPKPTP